MGNSIMESTDPNIVKVRRIALGLFARQWRATVDREELIAAGLLGLADALRRYTATAGVPFEAYAQTRIAGAILDEIRSRDLLSRDERNLQKQLAKTKATLAKEIGRQPEDEEVAERAGMPLPAYQRTIAQLYRRLGELPLAVHAPGDTPELLAAVRQEHAELNAQVDAMPERLRYVLRCYYVHDRSLRQIADRLHLTESRVCQLHAEAIRHLKAAYRRAGLKKCRAELAPAPAA